MTNELKKKGIGIAQGIADSSRVYILTKNRAELTALAYDARLGNRKDIVKYLIISDNQEKYRSLFKSGPNPIFVVEKKTFEILDANPNATELLGYERETLIGMSLFSLGNLDEGEFAHKYPEGETLVISSKIKFYKADGGYVFVNIHASASEYRNEDVIIVAATDITELVEKDSQLIQASKMTNLEKMSAGIVHEINQPLNAIKMGSEYLCMMNERKKKINDDDFIMVVEEISTQVSRAAEIVGRLKTFSRKADFSREVININDCIRSVNKIIGRQIALQNIEFILNLDESISPVLAHNNRMEQVVFNLVTNARDAINERIEMSRDIKKGMITIVTFSDNETVGVTISDNGVGIEPDQMDSIFESFYTTKEMGEGLGLGLPIIQGIVRDYNGTISVESSPGSGTSFKIMFPAHSKEN